MRIERIIEQMNNDVITIDRSVLLRSAMQTQINLLRIVDRPSVLFRSIDVRWRIEIRGELDRGRLTVDFRVRLFRRCQRSGQIQRVMRVRNETRNDPLAFARRRRNGDQTGGIVMRCRTCGA